MQKKTILRKKLENKFKNDLFRKSSIMAFSTGFSSISRFLLVTILARYLSPESYGVWGSITSVAAIMMFGDFGITNALRNKLAELNADKVDTDEIQREYFYSSFFFFLIFSILLSVIFVLLSDYIPIGELYNTQNELLRKQGVEIFVFIQIMFIMGIPFGIANGLFFSYDESKYAAIFSIINSVVTLGSVVILSFIFSADIVVLAKTYFTLNLLVNIISLGLFIYRRSWQKKLCINLKAFPKRIQELLSTGIMFLGVQLSTSYVNNLPTVFIGAVGDLKMAASFNIAQKLYTMAISIYQSVFNPIWSRLSLLASQQNWMELKILHRKIIIITFAVLFVFMLAMTCLSDFIFQIVVGDQYSISITMVILLGISTTFYAMFEATSLLQNALSKLKLRLTLQLFISLLINYSFNSVFAHFGIYSIPVTLCLIWIFLFVIINSQGNKLINSQIK